MNIEQLIKEVEKHEDQADRIFAAAMWYAANDIPILPADVNGRLPGKKFGNWNYGTSTTRPEKVTELFGVGGKFRGWNLSMPTGPVSGISVVDIDNKNGKDGTEAWSELEAAYGAVPEDVLIARTPSGGIHMFFEHRPGFFSSNPTTTASNGLLPGVDTRGGSKADKTKSGGHVLLYPSRKAGGQYTFDMPSSSPTIPPPPDWVIDLLAGVKPIVAEPSLTLPDVIPAGGRDTTLYNYALRLIARGYSDEDVEYHLTQAGNRLHPPDPAMVDKVIRSALSSQVHEKAALTQELSTHIRRNEKTGAILPTVENFYQIVQSTLFKSYVDLCYDEFRMRVVPTDDHRAPTNMDDAYNITERVLSREFALDKMRSIIGNHLIPAIREHNSVDSLRNYFDALPPGDTSKSSSQTPTIDHLSQTILGLEPGSLQDAYIRCWLRAGVYRAYYPGSKFDNILVLIGQQGIRKSTFFRALTPGESPTPTSHSTRHSWFTDSVGKDRDLSHPDEIRKLNGKFIGELAEMHGMSRSDIRAVKHFLSEQEGEYVQKYKEDVAYVPRRFILGGTSNESDYMGDDTGNRRFWNINLYSRQIDTNWVAENRNQIWAEAKYEVLTKNLPCILSKEHELMQIVDNKNFEQSDAWEEVVLDWASTRSRFTRAQVLVEVLGFELNQIKQQDQMRIGKIFKRAGWTTKQVKSGHHKARALINPDPDVEQLFKGKIYDMMSEV